MLFWGEDLDGYSKNKRSDVMGNMFFLVKVWSC